MTEHVSFKRADAAVQFVRDNAEKQGALVGACKAIDHRRKIAEDKALLEARKNNPTASVRVLEAKARTSVEYLAEIEELENTWADAKELETLILAAQMTYGLYKAGTQWGGP